MDSRSAMSVCTKAIRNRAPSAERLAQSPCVPKGDPYVSSAMIARIGLVTYAASSVQFTARKRELDVCRDCYGNGNKPIQAEKVRHRDTRRRNCTSCGEQRSCVDYLTTPLCVPCAGRPLRRCANCNEQRPVQAYLEIGPFCTKCYDRERQLVPGGDRRALVPPAQCTDCAQVVNLYCDGKCVTCVMKARVRELLCDRRGSLREDLASLYTVLVSGRDPRSVLGWLHRSDGAGVLRRIATDHARISHDFLDREPRSLAVEFIRSALIAAGLLQPITIQRRLDFWLDAFMLDVPKDDAFVVRTFAQWRILRRLRPKADSNKLTESGVKWAQMRIRTAAQFLAWLRQKDATLQGCTQSLIEVWLTEASVATPYVVRDFIRWTNSRRITSNLDVPSRQRTRVSVIIDDTERWGNIERLLADRTIPNEIRLIALLALVFAQHLSRVCMLTTNLVSEDSGVVFLTFGKDPVEMPPPLIPILLAQVDSAQANPKSNRSDGKLWLFPGQHFGTHVSESVIQRRLACNRRTNARSLAMRHSCHFLPSWRPESSRPLSAYTLARQRYGRQTPGVPSTVISTDDSQNADDPLQHRNEARKNT